MSISIGPNPVVANFDGSGNLVVTLANTMNSTPLPADSLGLLKDDGSGNLSWASINPLVATSLTVTNAATVGNLVVSTGGFLEITDGSVACSTGAATLTFKASNGSALSATQAEWIPIKVGASTYYVPAFSTTHA